MDDDSSSESTRGKFLDDILSVVTLTAWTNAKKSLFLSPLLQVYLSSSTKWYLVMIIAHYPAKNCTILIATAIMPTRLNGNQFVTQSLVHITKVLSKISRENKGFHGISHPWDFMGFQPGSNDIRDSWLMSYYSRTGWKILKNCAVIVPDTIY